MLALLWWCWIPYGWLANQTRADRGVIRIGIILATIGMFVIALAIPEAFGDRDGGLDAPIVLVVCYLLVRIMHGVLYFLAAGDDQALRRQVLVTVPAALIPAAILLFLGVAVGDPWQTWLWLAALLVDAAIVYATSRIGWRIHSAAHWSDRHGLIVILALGESVVSIGAGVARLPLSVPIVVGSALAVLLTFGMWWAYFERMAPAAREDRSRTARARTGPHSLGTPTPICTTRWSPGSSSLRWAWSSPWSTSPRRRARSIRRDSRSASASRSTC